MRLARGETVFLCILLCQLTLKQATGKAVGTNKDGSVYTDPFAWGCTNGTAKDGGTGFTTHIDTLVAFDSNNSNGGASIFKADTQDTETEHICSTMTQEFQSV